MTTHNVTAVCSEFLLMLSITVVMIVSIIVTTYQAAQARMCTIPLSNSALPYVSCLQIKTGVDAIPSHGKSSVCKQS